MVAPIRYLSRRSQQEKIGILQSTEDEKVLEVIGRVGIGTTIFDADYNLDVRGDVRIQGPLTADQLTVTGGGNTLSDLTVQNDVIIGGGLTVTGISTFASNVDINAGLDVDGNTELDTLNVSIAATTASLTLANIGFAVTAILDEDDLVSDRDDALATQQSIKAYVNDQLTTQDLDFAGDSGSGSIELNSETFTIAGTTNEIETVGFGNTLTVGLPNEVNITTSLTVGSATTITGSGIIAGIVTGTLDNDLTLTTSGTGLSGSATYNNSGVVTFTVTSDATDINTPSTIVSRDGSGNFSAGTIIADLTGVASTATKLETSRTFELTGDVVASQISFDGTGNVSLAATIQPNSVALGDDTTGDYVSSISGTSNQIAVDVTSGEGTTPVISIPDNPTLPGTTVTIANDLQVNRDLNVTGNVTIGGTSATLFTETLKISDPDIILGFRTDAGGNDVSNDTTANHGGIAVASTEGSPLISLIGAGETLPTTYKKIMWFQSGSFTGLATDAWLTNYAFGVGTTSMSAGTKFAVGNIETNFDDITSVRNINASGIITAASFVGDGSNITGLTAGVVGALAGISIREEGSVVGSAGSVGDINFVSSNLTATASGVGATITLTDDPTFNNVTIADKIIHTGDTDTAIRFPDDNTVTVETDGSESLRIDSDGNVGIGTNNPSYRLEVNGTAKATLFIGSGASLTNIPNGALDNSTVSYGGVQLSLGGSDATPAFDLIDATNYPYTSLTGVTTSIIGDTTPQLGGDLDVNGNDITGTGNINLTGIVTATSFVGSGVGLTGITAGGVGAITGVTIREEGSVVGSADSIGDINFVSGNLTASASGVGATITLTDDPNFTGVNVTGVVTATTFSGNLPTTDLTGTITNAQLAGSITNAKLVNDSVSFGGVSLDLGQTDATPAFNLTDATNYPYSSLTGITTEIVGDTTPQLGGDLDVNGNDITGTGDVNLTGVVTATSFVGDGSNLTGITAGGVGAITGVTIREEGSVVGSAGSIGDINFVSSNLTATASGVGATITLTDDPNFNGVNVTGVVTATTFSGNLPTTDLTGTITNAQLAGSITNAKLVNDSVSFGGVSLDLGQTDATPAFDLSDATNYPYNSLTGVTTSIIGDTTPQLGGDLDVNGNDITGTGDVNLTGVVTATSFVGDGSGLTGIAAGDTATANQIVFKNSSNVATGSTSLTYSGTYIGIGTVGIGTIIKNIHYDNLNDGTLSWEASEGQLFSITNNLTSGSIFSVNDVSGFPSIDVDADGTIQLAPISTIEYVGIGTTNPTDKLHVVGDARVGVNTSQGIILTSPNGTSYRLIVDNSGVLSTTQV